jgi:hypothetical protein
VLDVTSDYNQDDLEQPMGELNSDKIIESSGDDSQPDTSELRITSYDDWFDNKAKTQLNFFQPPDN